MLEVVKTVQQMTQAVIEEFKPDAVWSRSAPVGLGIRRGGYLGPLLHVYCTNAKMNCRGIYLQTHGLPAKRRMQLLALWPFDYLISSKIERELSRKSTAVAFSENMRRQLLNAFPKDARTCHIISPGVDERTFSPENGAQCFDQIEEEFGLDRNESIVLYVGRLSSAKHIPMLMEAVSSLKTPARLVLVGSGPEKTRLTEYAEKLGLSDRLVFAGTHSEMLPGFYAISRVCVLPTTTESFGQVYLESLASGTPAVGFAGDGRRVLSATAEIIKDGETGAVSKSVSPQSLARKIDDILSLPPQAYTAMSKRAREDVLRRFSWKQFVTKALELSAEVRNC